MKKFIIFIFVLFTLFSCKKEPKGDFESVTLYNYGRSKIGTTYDIPLKFIVNSTKEEVLFRLYSLDPNLAEGIYNYTDKDINDCRIWGPYNCTDKTFFKNRCKWGSSYIVDGYISVEKNKDIYTFVIGVYTQDGKLHTGQYEGKVQKKDWYEKSKIGGMFATLGVIDYKNFPPYLYPNYSGGVTMLGVQAGNSYYGLSFFILYMHENPNNPIGTYSITSDNVIQKIYTPDVTGLGTSVHLTSDGYTGR